MDRESISPYTTKSRDEGSVAHVIFGMAAENLKRSYAPGAIEEILDVFEEWRDRLLASKPPFQ